LLALDGRLLFEKRVPAATGTLGVAIDMQYLPAGKYLLRLIQDEVLIKKVVKY
jgi:hypothetical protein